MPITLPEMREGGIILELAKCFDTEPAAIALLNKMGVQAFFFRPFVAMPTVEWWDEVCSKIQQGMVVNGLDKLLQAAADVYPGNLLFKPYIADKSKPQNRNNVSGNIDLRLPSNLSASEVLQIIEAAKRAVIETGGDFMLNLGQPGSSRFNFSIENLPPEQIDHIIQSIQNICAERGVQAQVTRQPYNFRDYYTDPLTAEGPDGQFFALEQMRASTTVREVARGIINQYSDDLWPTAKSGQKQQAVVDLMTDEGAKRLSDPNQTLHDAGVRPGDTLRVAPERTAGAIDPLMREEALARARVQVLDHAAANPGFEVEANSLVAPTEYLFRFRTPSFAPGNPPRRVDEHEVYVELPPDYPVAAPLAFWQTEIFHPNIHSENGLVCLGDLQENYRPGLDFGDLCKMLMDIAAYRNYAFHGGYYNKEAAKWALSEEGQQAIQAIGGFSLASRLGNEAQNPSAPSASFRVRRIN